MSSFRPSEKKQQPSKKDQSPPRPEDSKHMSKTGVLVEIIGRMKQKEEQQKSGGSQFEPAGTVDKVGVFLDRLQKDYHALRRPYGQEPPEDPS